MTEAEELLVKIKFAVDMYSLGAGAANDVLEKIFDLVDSYKKEVTE